MEILFYSLYWATRRARRTNDAKQCDDDMWSFQHHDHRRNRHHLLLLTLLSLSESLNTCFICCMYYMLSVKRYYRLISRRKFYNDAGSRHSAKNNHIHITRFDEGWKTRTKCTFQMIPPHVNGCLKSATFSVLL